MISTIISFLHEYSHVFINTTYNFSIIPIHCCGMLKTNNKFKRACTDLHNLILFNTR